MTMLNETAGADKAPVSTSDSPFAALAALQLQNGHKSVTVVATELVSTANDGDTTPAAEPESAAAVDKKWALVTHRNDRSACLDALLCVWFMLRYVVKKGDYELCFVRSGERLEQTEEAQFIADGYEIVYLDTGGGACDQHGKKLARSSSFELTCQNYRRQNEPGLQVMLELSRKADNVEVIDPTSIYYAVRTLPAQFRDAATREVDWNKVIDFSFILFDMQFRRDQIVETNRRTYKRRGTQPVELKSGIKVASLIGHPEWRDAAFEAGADVVVWTVAIDRLQKDGPFYVGIQNHRTPKRSLKKLVAQLRHAEMLKRKVRKTDFAGMDRDGQHPQVPGWFLHDSENLIVCGSDTHPLEAHEVTALKPHEIMRAVEDVLGF